MDRPTWIIVLLLTLTLIVFFPVISALASGESPTGSFRQPEQTTVQSDFLLTSSPAQETIPLGQTATYIVNVTSIGGFNSPVSLTISGLPVGATASFSPPSVTPPAGGTVTITFTVAIPLGTPGGTYNLTITGTSTLPQIARSVAVTLYFGGLPVDEFTLSAYPSVVRIPPGQCGNVTVTLSTIATLPEVNLTITHPQNAQAQFFPDPMRIPAGGTGVSIVRICVGSNAPPGNYTMTIVATMVLPSGTVVHTAEILLTIPPQCIIATAAFGSELAAPVQFLRNFRDQRVDRTYLGHHFLTAFNAWYYSWAPSVASAEYENSELRAGVRAVITPLLGALFVSSMIFEFARPLNTETAILVAGIVASAILGLIYLTPLAITVRFAFKRRITSRTVLYLSILGIFLALAATLSHGVTGFTENVTALIVIEAIILPPALFVRAT